MPTAQFATREKLYNIIEGLSEEEATQVFDFVHVIRGEEPNAETIKAIEDSMHPENLTECSDIDDMFAKCGVKCGS